MKQICNTCGAQLNPTRDPDTLNCIYCGITTPASTSKAHVNPAASDVENQTDKS
jgi:DNA-directed RNA polymerase subunit M/transcription elongation factor TFIIS